MVDDDAAVRNVAAVILSELGFRVIEAGGAMEAMKVLRGPFNIDLLLTDLAMPDVSGTELAHLAKQLKPDLKVIYTSGHVRIADGDPALRYGPLIEKPWRLRQLRELVRSMFASPDEGNPG